jgi:RimJ/RimL family protein N-acetyltransferase
MARSLADLGPIATARLRLAVLTEADAPEVRRVTDDPQITARVDFLESPFTLEHAVRLVGRNRGADERMLGIRTADGRAFIGIIGAHFHGDAEIEIGYWLGRDFHGHGYASEAVAGLLAALHRLMPERRIVAECDPQNHPSWRVLIKAGFAPTGEPGLRPGRQRLALRGTAG